MKKACIQCGKDARLGEVNNVRNVFCAKRCQMKYHLVGLKDDALNINDDNLLGLVTSDGSRSTMSVETAEKIPLLKKMMEDKGSLNNYIPLSGVNSRSLALIRQFLDRDRIVSSLDDKDEFLNLLKAAEFLLFDDLIYYLMYPWIYQHELHGLSALKNLIPTVVLFHTGPLRAKIAEYASVFDLVKSFNDTISEHKFHTGFLLAVKLGNIAVVEYLLRRNIYINPSVRNNYAIRHASHDGHTEIVKLLLAAGADPTAVDNLAIQMASQKGHTEIVKLLLAAGADPTGNDNYAIQYASRNGHTEIVKLLLKARADPTADNNSAIRYASENGHIEVVKLLLKAGADPTLIDNYAIRLASQKGHTEVVKLLLKAGADPTANNNRAIQMTSENGHTEMVKLLLKAGADPTANGNYAIRGASYVGHAEVVKLLLEDGRADPKAVNLWNVASEEVKALLKEYVSTKKQRLVERRI
jgi:ankyrin repeat protein